MSKVRDFAEIISTGVASTDVSGLSTAITNEFTSIEHVSPSYIRTTLLYPAVSGNITNGTAHSGTYGDTVQTDGHKYYYTDIKGSKPIKDPRIGAHFGSQRHKFKSKQLLEQETATHGSNVYSVDGREWMRICGDWVEQNNTFGAYHYVDSGDATDTSFVEIVGYFNGANFITYVTTDKEITLAIDGTANASNFTGATASVGSPLSGRYVDAGSVVNLVFDATPSLGIHTLRIGNVNGDFLGGLFGFELIAQDTTDTASKSKIQIPAQTVISFNKQHSVSATAQHYDPFNGFTTGDLAAVQALGIDDTTSLGLSAWWYSNSSAYYRPYNGGRVVKWIDSSGTIKTSVNMMPFNATSVSNSNINKKENASATNNDNTPSFIAGAVDHSQTEVAKSFHWREFGNGGANGNTNYKDFSMHIGNNQTPAYVMDDGLTSMYYNGAYASSETWLRPENSGNQEGGYLTFIGTGFSYKDHDLEIRQVAQGLPYGTHIVNLRKPASETNGEVYIDGVKIHDAAFNDIMLEDWVDIHQPKMPPIPEDACVIADYMLMADFVPQGTAGIEYIPKGVRWVAQTRDYKIDKTAGSFQGTPFVSANPVFRGGQYFWWSTANSSGDTFTQQLPFFGDSFSCHFTTQGDSDYAAPVFTLDVGSGAAALSGFTNSGTGSGFTSVTSAGVVTETGNISNDNVCNFKAGAGTLGSNTIKCSITSNASSKYAYNRSFSVHTPIHTSSHYQSFETPFLHELVGGDRNMEQTNLVVTPDGKTWDEVTRDVSYIGNAKLKTAHDNLYGNVVNIFDEWRGGTKSVYEGEHFNKDFAIAYDRMICLKAGNYLITHCNWHSANDDSAAIKVNGTYMTMGKSNSSGNHTDTATVTVNLNRGDYVQGFGTSGDGSNQWKIHINFQIIEI